MSHRNDAVKERLEEEIAQFEQIFKESNFAKRKAFCSKVTDRHERSVDIGYKVIDVASEKMVVSITVEIEALCDAISLIKGEKDICSLAEVRDSKVPSNRHESAIAEALPRIKLENSGGNLADCEEWRVIFESLVHDNKRLSVSTSFSEVTSEKKQERSFLSL